MGFNLREMGGKLYENPAFDSGRENSGRMSFSGGFEFEKEVGKRVWFAEEPSGGTADSPERAQTKTQDSIDDAEIHAEHPDYSPRVSFRRLISIANEKALSMTDVQDTKTIIDAVLKRLEDGTSLSPTERHTLEVARALKDQSSRMTRKWTEELHTLRDKKQSLDSQGKSMETDEEGLLALLEQFNTVAPFMADRTNLDASGKYEIPEADLAPFKTAVDAVLAIDEGTRSQDQKDLVWVYDMLVAGDPLTEELEARRVALNTQKAGAAATPPTDNPLSADESLLLLALEMVNTHAPYGIAHPKAFTHLGRDWKEEVQKFDDKIYELQIGATSMSRQEVELIYQLNNKNFMGTQISTMDWMGYANFDPGKFGETFVGDQRRLHKADATPSANDADIAAALGLIATNIKLIKETVQSQVGIQQDIMQTHLERMEAVPLNNLSREVRRLGRRMKRGIELSIGRASDTEKAVAIGGAVVLLGALLMSKNEYVKAFQKFALGGGAGLAALLAIDVGSGAFFNGKRLSQKALAAMKVIGDGVSDEFYRVFEPNAQGNTQEEKRVEVGHLATLASMAQSNKFSELLTKYRAARGTTNEIHLDGVPDDGTIGDLKQKPSVVFFLAMDLFYRRYGKDIERWEAENDGKLPLASLTFMEILLEMVSEDKYYEEPGHPFYWFAEQVKKAGTAVGEWSLVMADRLGEYGSRFFGDKARIGDYLQEVFPEGDYGKGIGLEKGSPDERVLTLPGGVRVEFREETREKVQKKSPGREVNGFSLHNPYRTGAEAWVPFWLDQNDPSAIERFCKNLIVDTAKHKMTTLIHDNPAALSLMENFDEYKNKLYFNKGEKAWAVRDMLVGGGTYQASSGGTELSIEISDSAENVFLNFFALNQGTFGINFYEKENYWDKDAKLKAREFSYFFDEARHDRFAAWISENFGNDFPFNADDIEISNWEDIKDGQMENIEGVITTTSTTLKFRGVLVEEDIPEDEDGGLEVVIEGADGTTETVAAAIRMSFSYVDISGETINRAYKEKLDRTIDRLKKLGRDVKEDWFSTWRNLFGGSFKEGEWDEALDTKREIIKAKLDEGTILPESVTTIIKELDALADKMEETVALDEEVDKTEFDQRMKSIELLGSNSAVAPEYSYFRSKLEENFHFRNDNARYALLNLFVDESISAEALRNSTDGHVLSDAEFRAYMGYISQMIINHFYKKSAHRVTNPITEDDVESLVADIQEWRGREHDVRGVDLTTTPRMRRVEEEWPTINNFLDGRDGYYQYTYSIFMLQRAWLEHCDLVTEALTDKYRWHRLAGDEVPDDNRGIVYRQRRGVRGQLIRLPSALPVASKGDVLPPFPFLNWNELDSPVLSDLLEKVFRTSEYNILFATLDGLGIYSEGMERNVSYPGLLEGVDRFRKMIVIETEAFINEETVPTNSAMLEARLARYDIMIRGTETPYTTGLWEDYLRPELISKEMPEARRLRETPPPAPPTPPGPRPPGGGSRPPITRRRRN